MRRLLLAGVLALALLPGSASAASVQLLRYTAGSLAGPAIAGDSVVVDAYHPRNTLDVLAVAPGGQPRRLLRLAPPDDVNGTALLAASGDRVLLRRSFESGAADLLGGTIRGPLSVIESCPQESQLSFPPAPAIDGDLSAWTAADCVRDRVRIQLGASQRTVDAGGYIPALAAAGRYVAWIGGQRLTVYDAQAGSVAYSVAIPPATFLDVDADGTAVIAPSDVGNGHGACGHDFPDRITYYTPAEPAAHLVPVSSCREVVKIAGGRIAFVERLGDGSDELALTDLAGRAVRPVAHVDALGSFDFDGSRVAWTQRRCLDTLLLRRDASDSSAQDPAVRCPVRVGSPRLARDGTLHVAVACPNGCRPEPGASLQGLELISPNWLHVWRRSGIHIRYSPFVPLSMPPGGRTVARLPLTARQRALLRRHRRVSVRLKVLFQDVYLPRVIRTARAG
jgi:hypothetical protein